MDMGKLDLLSISAFLLNDRELLIPFFEEAGAKLTIEEDNYLRFDFDNVNSLVVKYDKKIIILVSKFSSCGDKSYLHDNKVIEQIIESYQSALVKFRALNKTIDSSSAIILCNNKISIKCLENVTKVGFISYYDRHLYEPSASCDAIVLNIKALS
jgi:hypothetical protein